MDVSIQPIAKSLYQPGSMSARIVRYNSSNSGLEVYDGNVWLSLNGHANIGLTTEAQATLEWAYKKMKEDEELEALMAKHPGLKDLHEKFMLMKALVAQYHKNP
jgi:hypothetical protein